MWGKEQEQGKPASTKTEEGLHECVLTDEHTHNTSVDTAAP